MKIYILFFVLWGAPVTAEFSSKAVCQNAGALLISKYYLGHLDPASKTSFVCLPKGEG